MINPISTKKKLKIDKINKFRIAATMRYPKSYVAVDEDSGEIIKHSTKFSTVFLAAKVATENGRHISVTKDVKADTLCLV